MRVAHHSMRAYIVSLRGISGKKTRVMADTWAHQLPAPSADTTIALLDPGPNRRARRAKPLHTPPSSAACPHPLHPKLAQRRLLPEVVLAASRAIGYAELKRLAAAWDLRAGASKVITVGTACSGSELYLLSLQPLAARLLALTGCNVSF